MKVGFIGLGRMGKPMCQNLLKAGFDLTVHNRSRPKVEELVRLGARPAGSPEEVAQASDMVLACLPDVSASEEVFLGRQGLVPAARPGQPLLDCSTVGPSTSRRVAQAARARGAYFLDAPVSGGVERAANGTLTIMVGGDKGAFQRALPVLQVLGSTVKYVGPSGSGSVVKLVNQLLVGIHSLAAAEALNLGIKAGADPNLLLEVLNASWGASFMLSRNAPVMLNRDFSGARAPIRLLLKDLMLIGQMAQELRVPLPAGNQALGVFQQAADQGKSELDLSAIVSVLEKGLPNSATGA